MSTFLDLDPRGYGPRTYFGISIWPLRGNSSGLRWQATVNGANLRADTLQGIKELIRHELKKAS